MQTTKILFVRRSGQKKRLLQVGASALHGQPDGAFSPADLAAVVAALDGANLAAEQVIASVDRLHKTLQDCRRELHLARQIVAQSNHAARLAAPYRPAV